MSTSYPLTSIRIAIACAGFFSALFLSPWIPVLAIVLLALRFRAWEGILLGLFLDLLWLPLGGPFVSVPFYTIASVLIVWGLEPLRLELFS